MMLNTTTHTQTWLADLDRIIAEIDMNGISRPAKTARRKRARKPLWEE